MHGNALILLNTIFLSLFSTWNILVCKILNITLYLHFVSQSLDELDDDDTGDKARREEEELVQANTFQNEAMTSDPATGHLLVRSDMTGSGKEAAAPLWQIQIYLSKY